MNFIQLDFWDPVHIWWSRMFMVSWCPGILVHHWLYYGCLWLCIASSIFRGSNITCNCHGEFLNPIKARKWPACNISLQKYCWIIHKDHKNSLWYGVHFLHVYFSCIFDRHSWCTLFMWIREKNPWYCNNTIQNRHFCSCFFLYP